jgi:hypothetical protein
MGEGGVVMLNTLRRVEALLDRVSFLGPKRPRSEGSRHVGRNDDVMIEPMPRGNRHGSSNDAIIKHIIKEMGILVKTYGLRHISNTTDQCEVTYQFKDLNFHVRYVETGSYVCHIVSEGGEVDEELTATSISEMIQGITDIMRRYRTDPLPSTASTTSAPTPQRMRR